MDTETKKQLLKLFEDESICLIGRPKSDGADSYFCPSCFKSEYITGCCNDTAHITHIRHTEDCELMNLYKEVNDGNEPA